MRAKPGILVLGLACLWIGGGGRAEDQIFSATRELIRSGTVTHCDAGGIWVKTAEADSLIPWKVVGSVRMAEPPDLKAARGLYEAAKTDASKWGQAATALQLIVDKFQRLPVDWEQDSTIALIEAYGSAGNLDEAQKWMKNFDAWYKHNPKLLKAVASLAKGLAAGGKYDEGIKLIESATEAQRLQLTVTEEEGKSLGVAMNVLGDCYAQKGDLPKALEAYLMTKVLYYHDAEAVKVAAEKAEALKPKVTALIAKQATNR